MFKVDALFLERLYAATDAHGLTMSEFIRQTLAAHFDYLEECDPKYWRRLLTKAHNEISKNGAAYRAEAPKHSSPQNQLYTFRKSV